MKTTATISGLQDAIKDHHGPIVVVPTMGALHDGHASLIDLAREHAGENGLVIATVFVNPTQFDRAEDLDSYPSTLEADLKVCESKSADIVFHPTPGEAYADDHSITIRESALSQHLCGATRTGHFDGVCTIVTKLFMMTRCSKAVFGSKDFQQLAIIRRLVRDLNLPVEIIAAPTVRETDGLAMSSRNALLTPEQRKQAPQIYKALQSANKLVNSGTERASVIAASVEKQLKAIAISPAPRIDYLQIVSNDTLEPVQQVKSGKSSIAVAIFFGSVRLIDHVGL